MSGLVVIKLGGSILDERESKVSLIQDIVRLKENGLTPVVVHGGGKHIDRYLKQVGSAPRFVNGLRYTDAQTMEVAEMVLSGLVNKDLVSEFEMNGSPAIGISGKDMSIITASKLLSKGMDIGFVGQVDRVNTAAILKIIDLGVIPVISPISLSKEGVTLNINADYAAMAVAAALDAPIVYVTDVDGVYGDLNDKSTIYHQLNQQQVASLIEEDVIKGGMLPKVDCCIQGLASGIEKVYMINGQTSEGLSRCLLNGEKIGTLFIK